LPDSLKILQTLNNETRGPHDTDYDHLESIQVAVEKCLPAIKGAARRDLGLPSIKSVED
jgi:hypothetical protein